MNPKLEIRSFLVAYVPFALLMVLLGAMALWLSGNPEKVGKLILAWGVSFLVILAGFLANYWAFHRSHKVFMGVLLGGMVIRIAIIGGIVAIFFLNHWKFFIWFLILLTIYYFLFQVVEIVLINRQLKKQVDEKK